MFNTVRLTLRSRSCITFSSRTGRRCNRCQLPSSRHSLFHIASTSFSTKSDSFPPPNIHAILTVGIPRETYDPWERRSPLTPSQVKKLIQDNGGRLGFIVQPSARRIFADHEYSQADAVVAEDLSPADIVMGVKRPKKLSDDYLIPNKTYMFFSHTIKGQPENMSLLNDCLERKIQLMDYERITTNKTSVKGDKTSSREPESKRLVSFGRFAGIAGSMDSFHALGRKLLYARGTSTSFLTFPPSVMHDSLDEAKERVLRLGERIFHEGIRSSSSEPIVFAVTGKGGCVHGGAMEILQMLPHEKTSVSDLPELFQREHTGLQNKIHIVPVDMEDVFQRRSGDSHFDKYDYKKFPTEYRSLFAKRVAPYAQVIINCAYWDARFPRLLTKRQMRRLREDGNERLLLVADISCDVHGAIEFLERTTTIEKPFFQYDPHAEKEVDDENLETGITVLGVDILPAELPRESSAHFGDALTGVVQELLHAKEQQESDLSAGIDTAFLSHGLADSCITTIDGKLAPGFQYLKTLMNRAYRDIPDAKKSMTISLDGHLFDSGLINQILDVCELHGSGIQFKECIFPPNSGRASSKSHVVLEINCVDEEDLLQIEQKINSLVEVIEKAQATAVRVDRSETGPAKSLAHVEDLKREKRVLCLGSGFVARSFVDYLGRSGDSVITVVSDKNDEAREAASAASKGQHVCLDVANDLQRLSSLIEDSDLVVSLLPASMHPPVAMECIVHKTDLVTASYESDEMRKMHEQAKANGIVILNEVGLDPGLDHMSAMKIIDDIKARGGRITSFSSVCGGLPAPESVKDLPLNYKFSWSPKGVLSACQNDARYREDGVLKEIRGSQLLESAAPFADAWPSLELECLPNRDALKYQQVYGISPKTIFRGTLRYRGFSSLMNTFLNLGLFDSISVSATTWAELIDEIRARRGGFENVPDFVLACADDDRYKSDLALGALEWLEMLGENKIPKNSTVIDAFCNALQQKLVYEEGERDMVLMHHTIDAEFEEAGKGSERHHSSLKLFGDESMSAMAKTVGFTAAASAELVISGVLKDHSGLVLPTNRKVYAPVLDSLEPEGIVFDESVASLPRNAD